METAPNTANSYLSHAIKRAVGNRAIDNNDGIRTHFIKGVLRGLCRKHDRGRPARERTRVPLTYALVETAAGIIDATFGRPEDRITLRAALAFSYELSLRPGEYFAMTGNAERSLDEQATAGAAFLWWNGRAYSICAPEKFPSGPADTSSQNWS